VRFPRTLVHAAAVITAVGCACSQSRATGECKHAKLISDEQKQVSLFLPESAQTLIRQTFPDLHVPGKLDMKDLWVTDTEPGSLPYFVRGDFNGDGREDFALVLAGEKQFWIAIFQGRADCTYTVGYRTGPYGDTPLQSVFLQVIPKGEEKAFQSIGPDGKTVESLRYKFPFDALEWTMVGGGVALVHWENGKYEVSDLGNE